MENYKAFFFFFIFHVQGRRVEEEENLSNNSSNKNEMCNVYIYKADGQNMHYLMEATFRKITKKQ